jgi:hypothetical protein
VAVIQSASVTPQGAPPLIHDPPKLNQIKEVAKKEMKIETNKVKIPTH